MSCQWAGQCKVRICGLACLPVLPEQGLSSPSFAAQGLSVHWFFRGTLQDSGDQCLEVELRFSCRCSCIVLELRGLFLQKRGRGVSKKGMGDKGIRTYAQFCLYIKTLKLKKMLFGGACPSYMDIHMLGKPTHTHTHSRHSSASCSHCGGLL